jgi:hypothetical protein
MDVPNVKDTGENASLNALPQELEKNQLTLEQRHVVECFKTWLDIRHKNHQGDSPTSADIDHSALLWRMIVERKQPLLEPPLLHMSCPDYNSVEGDSPKHPWDPYRDPTKCASCHTGHRWERDKEIHPRCVVCGGYGHLACLREKSVEVK